MSENKIITTVEQYMDAINKSKEVLIQKIKDTQNLLRNLEREYEQKLGMFHTSKQILDLIKANLDAKVEQVKQTAKEENRRRTAEGIQRLKQLKKEREAEAQNRTVIK